MSQTIKSPITDNNEADNSNKTTDELQLDYTKMYEALRDLCEGGTLHASYSNYPELSRLIESLETLGVRIMRNHVETIHDTHSVWHPEKNQATLLHHYSYFMDGKGISIFLPLIERYGVSLIERSLVSEGV